MGGSNIVAAVINEKFPFLSVGKIVLLFNSIVIVSAAFASTVVWEIKLGEVSSGSFPISSREVMIKFSPAQL